MQGSIQERLYARLDRSGECWVWTGKRQNWGYGQIRYERKMLLVHRVSYELHVGPIPDGLTIDHLCWNKVCVRPDHLEAVTLSTNLKRRLPYTKQRRSHCRQGHELTPANTYKRQCRICQRAAVRRYRQRKRETG